MRGEQVKQADLSQRIQAEARATAHGLFQSYLGPDHELINMQSFYSALVHALVRRGSLPGSISGNQRHHV